MGIELTTWVCVLTGNQTHDVTVHGTTHQLTEPHWPGPAVLFLTRPQALDYLH